MGAYLGQIILFAGPFEIEGWMLCDGRELDIQSHQALYSILGEIYGGTYPKTFRIPDLRNALPAHAMQPRRIGEVKNAPSLAKSNGTEEGIASGPATLSMNYMICVSGAEYPSRSDF